MTSILNFKDIVDLPKFRVLSPPLDVGGPVLSDLRNNEDRHPCIFMLTRPSGGQNVMGYYPKNDEWIFLRTVAQNISLAAASHMPAQGPRGTIAAGATTTSFTLTTALPATVGTNQLANRGDGRGFKIRIIGNAAISSGKTEERLVIANTSGTTPTITLDSPLSFAPILGDAYEFLSGRLYLLTSNQFNYYDILTNSGSAGLSIAGTTVGATNKMTELDESFVPYNRSPGEGFLGNLTATGSGGTTITGQAAGGDSGVLINEYRNFQIRIIEDTTFPQAVGQRRNITNHSAGPLPSYTVPIWSTTPSATAKYVIENNGDRILYWNSSNANTNTYSISGNIWSTAIFSARPSSLGAGAPQARQSFSIAPDIAKNSRHSFIYSFRGGSTLDLFDIAGAATGTWTGNITYGNAGQVSFGDAQGTCFSTQDPATMQGRYMYIFPKNYPNRLYRFDMQNLMLEVYANNRLPAQQFFVYTPIYTVFVNGNTKLSFMICLCQTSILGLMTMGIPIIR